MNVTIDADADVAAIARIQGGEEEALAELYDRHGRAAYALAYRVVGDPETAEEVVQEVWLSVWRRAAGYQPERGSVRSWLLAGVRHRAIDVLRARQARPRTSSIDNLPLAAPDDPAARALSLLESRTLRTAVATLPPEQRAAVELAYFAELPYPEIARRLGVPLGTVKSRLRLALGRLRGRLAAAEAVA